MISYREKLIDDISKLNEDQLRKIYHFFQMIKKEFLQTNNDNWKNDFRKISTWKNDDFDQIEKGFQNWKISKF